MGDITLELYPDEAPKACENFVTHIKNGYYDGTLLYVALYRCAGRWSGFLRLEMCCSRIQPGR